MDVCSVIKSFQDYENIKYFKEAAEPASANKCQMNPYWLDQNDKLSRIFESDFISRLQTSEMHKFGMNWHAANKIPMRNFSADKYFHFNNEIHPQHNDDID